MYGYDRTASRFKRWTRKERDRELGRVWDYIMDLDADGGRLPPKIQRLVGLHRKMTEAEEDEMLEWGYSNVPGYYSYSSGR